MITACEEPRVRAVPPPPVLPFPFALLLLLLLLLFFCAVNTDWRRVVPVLAS